MPPWRQRKRCGTAGAAVESALPFGLRRLAPRLERRPFSMISSVILLSCIAADRLSTRWDRFSWFGLLTVSEAGELSSVPDSYLGMKIIPAVEAILIEA